MLIRVVAPHFVCGVVTNGRSIIRAAPIMRWSLGWSLSDLLNYMDRKRWKWEMLDADAL